MIAQAKPQILRLRPIPIYRQQADFLASQRWLSGFCGGRGTGKTWIGSYRVIRTARAGDPWMCISPDAGVVTETTYPTFVDVAEQCGVLLGTVQSPYHRVTFQTRDGGRATIVFRSAEKPDKLRGSSKAGLWIDEASIQPDEVYDVAVATLRHKGRMGPCLMTFTPRGRGHWTFERFFDVIDPEDPGVDLADPAVRFIQGRPYRLREGAELVQARSSDNPFLPPDFVATLRTQYSSNLAAQELEGDFVDVAGLVFRREWFRLVDAAPREAARVRYWDRAATEATHGSACYSAGVLMARDSRGIYYVEDVVRGQWSAMDRDRVIVQTAERDAAKYGNEVVIYAEQEGGSGGKEVMQQMIRMLAGYPVHRDIVSGQASRKIGGVMLPGPAKVVRAQPMAAQAEAGNLAIVRGRWNADYLDELGTFPESAYADQVDASSGAFNRLAGRAVRHEAPTRSIVEPNSARFGETLKIERLRRDPGRTSR